MAPTDPYTVITHKIDIRKLVQIPALSIITKIRVSTGGKSVRPIVTQTKSRKATSV